MANINRVVLVGNLTKDPELRHTPGGTPVCVTVTHLDGLVLARSAFHSSMNYRSVMVFGEARAVDEPEEKRRGLDLQTGDAPEMRRTVLPEDVEQLLVLAQKLALLRERLDRFR